MRDNSENFNCKCCKYDHHCDALCEWPESIGAAGWPIIEVRRNGFEYKSTTCLLPQITDKTNRFFKLYKHYQNGVLLFDGGLYDQPAAYLEAMEIIDTN